MVITPFLRLKFRQDTLNTLVNFQHALPPLPWSIFGERIQLLERRFKENLTLREVERLIHAEDRIRQRGARLRPWRTQAFDLRLEGGKIGRLNVWETPAQKQKIEFSALMDKAMGERLNAQLTEFLNRFLEEAGEWR
jgi:hypothetical protein